MKKQAFKINKHVHMPIYTYLYDQKNYALTSTHILYVPTIVDNMWYIDIDVHPYIYNYIFIYSHRVVDKIRRNKQPCSIKRTSDGKSELLPASG